MKHVIYALFQAEDEVQAAMHDIEALRLGNEVCHVAIHRGRLNTHDLTHSETDSWHGLTRGILAGTLGGAIFGAILGALHLFPLGPLPMAAFLGVLGAIFGALGPMLYGAAMPDQNLQHLSKTLQKGGILLTAEVEGMMPEAQVEQIFSKHGAVETSRAAV